MAKRTEKKSNCFSAISARELCFFLKNAFYYKALKKMHFFTKKGILQQK